MSESLSVIVLLLTFLISRKMRRLSTAREEKGMIYMNTRYIQVT